MTVAQKNTTLPRRRVLQMPGAVAACPVCAGLAGRAFATDINMQPAPAAGHGTPTPDAHAAPHWEYGGAGGPEHWGELSPDFQACAMGREPSPIDLRWGAEEGPDGEECGRSVKTRWGPD